MRTQSAKRNKSVVVARGVEHGQRPESAAAKTLSYPRRLRQQPRLPSVGDGPLTWRRHVNISSTARYSLGVRRMAFAAQTHILRQPSAILLITKLLCYQTTPAFPAKRRPLRQIYQREPGKRRCCYWPPSRVTVPHMVNCVPRPETTAHNCRSPLKRVRARCSYGPGVYPGSPWGRLLRFRRSFNSREIWREMERTGTEPVEPSSHPPFYVLAAKLFFFFFFCHSPRLIHLLSPSQIELCLVGRTLKNCVGLKGAGG